MTRSKNAQAYHEEATLNAMHRTALDHMNACKVHTHSYRAWYNVYAITNGIHTYEEVKEHMALLCNGFAYHVRKNIYRKVLDHLNASQTKQE